VRALGGGEGLAWTLHGIVMAATALYVCRLWCSRAPFELKAAALATGALLMTPYLFIYDLVILAVPMAFLVRLGRTGGFLPGEVAGLAAASLLILIFLGVTAPWGLAATAIVAALVIRRVHAADAAAAG
jgi:arabinofuranan 3-O-arabinosyltransferase